jgi:hypothetical protein
VKRIVLGDEFDDQLATALSAVLRRMGAVGSEPVWGVAGSQEIHSHVITISGATITVESETYVGLTITGPDALVEEIASLLKEQSGSTAT